MRQPFATGCREPEWQHLLRGAWRLYRFTETTKWDDPWFEELPPWGKLLWLYACDKCDHVGYLAMSKSQAERHCGIIDWGSVPKLFASRMDQISEHAWLLPKFLYFQQKNLEGNTNMIKRIRKDLDKHELKLVGKVVYPKDMKGLEGATKLPRYSIVGSSQVEVGSSQVETGPF